MAVNWICSHLESDSFSGLNAVFQLASYCVGMVAAIFAVLTYRTNSQREHAKWAVQLYEKFYEKLDYKRLRGELDCDANTSSVQELVRAEDQEFTDYLNFFEMVTGLAKTKQLLRDDILRLFEYYLQCLKRHETVMRYINDPAKGYETLRAFLAEVKLK
jgi:hypothetical protein